MDVTTAQPLKEQVAEFWDGNPCGAKHASDPEGTLEFYAQVERKRDELEPFIADYADFAGARDQTLLEIGVGVGTDFVKFARAGARVTGVDLTEHAVELTRRRLSLEGLEGDVKVADAESLPFPDDTFDRVYSWGVLHHTPDTSKAIAEAMRVLRPGGRLCVMMYGRRSWVAYGVWVRHALLAGHPRRSIADVLAHHMESDGTKGYSVAELRQMFASVSELEIRHVGTPYDRRVAGPVAGRTGQYLGWFVVVRGRKPTPRSHKG